jgi:hypothetical protein
MRRVVVAGGIIVGLLLSSPLFAQSKAKAQNVPEIPFDSVPNFLKFPPNIYLGEGIGVATNSKGHVFVYTRSGDTRLFVNSAPACTGSRSRTPCASTRTTTSGPSTKAPTWSSSSTRPDG